MFQVGRAQAPEKDDPTFNLATPAIRAALAQNEDAPDTVIAVWQLHESGRAPDVYFLIYQGIVFYSATGPH